jgi:hypothetical protein
MARMNPSLRLAHRCRPSRDVSKRQLKVMKRMPCFCGMGRTSSALDCDTFAHTNKKAP